MTTQTEAQQIADELKNTPFQSTRYEAAAELRRLEAANAELLTVLGDILYALEKARIWGGMDWAYNPLHPVHYLPARDKARAAIEAQGVPQYDQQALELCEACGWKTLIPDEGCLNCERKPLTDEQINQMWSDAHNDTSPMSLIHVLARAIEAAHGIKE